jgi:hypothetical protein
MKQYDIGNQDIKIEQSLAMVPVVSTRGQIELAKKYENYNTAPGEIIKIDDVKDSLIDNYILT